LLKELFSVPWAVELRLAAWWLVVGLLGSSSPGAEPTKRSPAEWVPLKGCRFMTEEVSDGDSFHVKFGQREFTPSFFWSPAATPRTATEAAGVLCLALSKVLEILFHDGLQRGRRRQAQGY